MISKEELRIGNKVGWLGRVYTVTQILNDGALADYPVRVDHIDFCDLQPIPLTEETLLKCWFDISTKQSLEKHGSCHYKISMKDSSKTFYFWYGIDGNKYEYHAGEWTIKLESLHQLQNLFYDITGTELSIDLS